MFEITKIKSRSFVSWLKEHYPGSWKYCRHSKMWICEDRGLQVTRVATGRDLDGEYTGEWSMCLYGLESGPKWLPFSGIK